MEEFLKPIKTTKKVQSISKLESLSLTENKSQEQNQTGFKGAIIEIDSTTKKAIPIQISEQQDAEKPTHSKQASSGNHKKHKRHNSTAFLQHLYLRQDPPISLSDDAKEILRGQPCHEDLQAVLEYLQYGINGQHDFDVRAASPRSAQIVNILVTVTISDIWTNLRQKDISKDELKMKRTILACLASASGLGALISRVRQLSSPQPGDNTSLLHDTLSVLGEVLRGTKILSDLLQSTKKLYKKDIERRLCWQDLTILLAGGRILSIVAQAFTVGDMNNTDRAELGWLASGSEYSRWLAKNIVYASTHLQPTESESWSFVSQLWRRGLSLGHRDLLVSEIYTSLLLKQRALWTPLHQLLRGLPSHDQKIVFDTILYDLNRTYLSSASMMGFSEDDKTQKKISGAAALVAGLVKNSEILEQHLEEWLVVANASYASIGLASRRTLIAVLAKSEDKLEDVLSRSLSSFADKLQIQHGSVLQQEAYAQTILLLIGRLKRSKLRILKSPSTSSVMMRSVSNRLAASIPRARMLGMIVGVAMSKATDAPENVLDFGTEEMGNEEAVQWLNLTELHDSIGSIEDLTTTSSSPVMLLSTKRSVKANRTDTNTSSRSQTSKIISIEEVSDSSSEEEDDLVPYQKPDSDPEDSEEDPTLINRSKLPTPVYIVDLIKNLGNTENSDAIALALETAPSLIRRKANFGTEVSDNIHSLATALVNLQEGLVEPHLRQLRVESMIACVVARPETIGPSFATLYFDGDFSIFQRVTLLTAIGLGAREIAGYKDGPSTDQNDFPSKRLPAHLVPTEPKRLSALSSNPISDLVLSAAQSTIQPMALAAADKATGPSILKIRTFSSRMDVQKRRDQKSQARTKIVPKNLHSLLTKSFYLPICCRMSLLLSYAAGASLNTTILDPGLVKMLLQTLALVLFTLGPSASLHLSTLTHETLLLLTSMHTIPNLSNDPIVLPALLNLLLTLTDLTIEAGVAAQDRLITEYGVQMAELVNWAGGLGEKISVPVVSGDDVGGMPWTVLAAGIQVKWYEIGQRFQGRMLGLMSNDLDGLDTYRA